MQQLVQAWPGGDKRCRSAPLSLLKE